MTHEEIILRDAFESVLHRALVPYIERELKAAYRERWWEEGVLEALGERRDPPLAHLDSPKLLKIMWHRWNEAFAGGLGRRQHNARNYVAELRSDRNRLTHDHQELGPPTRTEAHRTLDTMSSLLTLVAPDGVRDVAELKVRLDRPYESTPRRVLHVSAMLVATNNRRLALLAGVTGLVFIIALAQGAGEPILWQGTRDALTTVRQDDTVQRIVNFLWQGAAKSNAELGVVVPGEPAPTRTWFWWSLFGVLFVGTVAYVPFAFRDETFAVLELIGGRLAGATRGVVSGFGEFLLTLIGRQQGRGKGSKP